MNTRDGSPNRSRKSSPDLGVLLGLNEVAQIPVGPDFAAASLHGISYTLAIEETARWAHAIFRTVDGAGVHGKRLTLHAMEALGRRTEVPFDLSKRQIARAIELVQERRRLLLTRPGLALLRGFLAQHDTGEQLTRGRTQLELEHRAVLLKTLLWLNDQHVNVPDNPICGMTARTLERVLLWYQLSGQPGLWDNPLESLGRLDWWREEAYQASNAYGEAVSRALLSCYGTDDLEVVVLTLFGLLVSAMNVEVGRVPRIHRQGFVGSMQPAAAVAVGAVLDRLTTNEANRKRDLRKIWQSNEASSLFFRPDLERYSLSYPLLDVGEYRTIVDSGCLLDLLRLLTRQVAAPRSDSECGGQTVGAKAGPLHERYVAWLFEGTCSGRVRAHRWPKAAGNEKFDVMLEDGAFALVLQCKSVVRTVDENSEASDQGVWNRHKRSLEKAADQIAETVEWWFTSTEWPKELPSRGRFKDVGFAIVADGLPLGSTSTLAAIERYDKMNNLMKRPPVLALRDIEALAALDNLEEAVRQVVQVRDIRPGGVLTALLETERFRCNDKLLARGEAVTHRMTRFFDAVVGK